MSSAAKALTARQFFSRSGVLSKWHPRYEFRAGQLEMAEAVEAALAEKKHLLVDAGTGTGKTLLCAALIRRFLATRNAERVLFIVDRIELAKQTLEDFNVVLAEYKPVLYKTARRRPPSVWAPRSC